MIINMIIDMKIPFVRWSIFILMGVQLDMRFGLKIIEIQYWYIVTKVLNL
jgi:hypothetical protein